MRLVRQVSFRRHRLREAIKTLAVATGLFTWISVALAVAPRQLWDREYPKWQITRAVMQTYLHHPGWDITVSRDAWGTALARRLTPDGRAAIVSAGEDGRFGTSDDLSVEDR